MRSITINISTTIMIRPSAEFKGKRLDNEEWVYGSFVVMNGEYMIWKEPTKEKYDLFGFYKVDPDMVCMFINAADKNGRKIFHGDIVRYYSCTNKEEAVWLWHPAGPAPRSWLAVVIATGHSIEFVNKVYEGKKLKGWPGNWHEEMTKHYDSWEVVGNCFDDNNILQ